MSIRRLDQRPEKKMSKPNMQRALARLIGELNAVVTACPEAADNRTYVEVCGLLDKLETTLPKLWE
jgi:hypothetical protein